MYKIHKNIDNDEKIKLIEILLTTQITVASGSFELIDVLMNKYTG